jgi:hypothetical protein
VNDWTVLDRFLHTDPHDVGCEKAMELLHVYVDLVATDIAAAERYPGVAAHLAACGPCSEDFAGLLAAVVGTAN